MSNENIIAANFTRSEDQLRKDWLRLLIDNPHAPLDVAYKAKITNIQREYYPYAIYEMTCECSWSATSIWEHEEQREVPVTKYQDYRGDLKKSNGTDLEVRNGHTYHHTRTPVTVFETETYTVTDSVQLTSDTVGPVDLTRTIWSGPDGEAESLLDWSNHIASNQFNHIVDFPEDVTVIPEGKSHASAQNEAIDAARKSLTINAKNEVPGTRYEDFQITGFETKNISRTTAYLPVYHVFYEYENQQFDCLMTGGTATSDALATVQPTDEAIKQQHESLDETMKQNNGCSQFMLIVIAAWTGFPGLSLLLYAIAAFIPMFSHGFDGGQLALQILAFIAGLALVGVAAKCIFDFFSARQAHREAKSTKEKIEADSSLIKQQILELIGNDSLSEEQKSQAIKELIAAFNSENLSKNSLPE